MSIIHSVSRRSFILSCLSSSFISCALASKSSGDKFESNSFEPFTFVFISDCHLTSGLADNLMLLQESQLFLQEAVKQINVLRPDFVIFGGDQVQGVGDDESHWQLFLDIVQNLNCPWHFVLGETDISGNMPINKMGTFGRDWKGKGLNNNMPYWSCDPLAGLHLVGLDTSQVNSVTGYMDEVQLEWLKEDISLKPRPVTIIVSHHPILAPIIDSKNSYLLPQAGEVRQILEKSAGQVISMSGHTHLSKIQWQNNIWYISSPSLDIYPCAFRFCKITPQVVQVQTYQVNFPALAEKAKTNMLNSNFANSLNFHKSRDLVRAALGSHFDQNAKLSLTEPGKIEAHLKVSTIR
jgi:3',5'-cyclic-AMP phosphodiesterase